MPYAIAAVAVALVWWFAAVTVGHAGTMGLPLDDGYIYMTYAKQFGRAEPFTYYTGGGYSAGSTSVLWPMVLAPFWTLGARGHALVWVSFGLCGALYTATCVGCYRVVRTIAGIPAGVVAAAIVITIGPFAWTALSEACHHRAYDVGLTQDELRGHLAAARAFRLTVGRAVAPRG